MRAREITASFKRAQHAGSVGGMQVTKGEYQSIVKRAKAGGFKPHEKSAVAVSVKVATLQGRVTEAMVREHHRVEDRYDLPRLR